MKYIKRFLKSILQLIISLLFSVGIIIFNILSAILVIPFVVVCWIISLFYVDGIEGLTQEFSALFDSIDKVDSEITEFSKNNTDNND